MTATYAAPNATSPVVGHGLASALHVVYSLVTISTAPLINDVLQFCTLPKNSRVQHMTLKASDMDTSTGILIDVGDAGSATRYFSSSTVGQAATSSEAVATTGLLYLNTAKTAIVGLIHTAPSGTGSTGTVELAVWFTIEDSATS